MLEHDQFIAQAISSWPSQTHRDIEKLMVTQMFGSGAGCNSIFDVLNLIQLYMTHGDWKGIIHPLGLMYYFNMKLDAPSQHNFGNMSSISPTASVSQQKRFRTCGVYFLMCCNFWILRKIGGDDKPLEGCRIPESFVTDPQSHFLMEPAVFSYDHNWFLQYYGQPEAHPICSHSVLPPRNQPSQGVFWIITVAALLGLLIFEFHCLDHIYVNGMVNAIDIEAYIDKTSSNVKFQMGLILYTFVASKGFEDLACILLPVLHLLGLHQIMEHYLQLKSNEEC
ncbi:hypothetical protein BDN67DRAFT_985043 [Paxillus ammoniavirescens]|nr:hypothetical protein BDN67DRAFT_985043 [Paxillus ammoniavirescens]